MQKSILIILTCFLFLNCEDKKKQDDTVDNEIKVDTIVKTKAVNEKLQAKEEEDTLHKIVKLTNDTLKEFLLDYGKENPERFVSLETPHGVIELELYTNTPIHRANFIYLIKTGYLNTTFFHRVVENFMIQGGNSDRVETSKMRGKMGKYTLPAEIIHKHRRGALAAAKEYRDNPDDRSSPFEFYIVQNPSGAHHLDPNYTVFGKVVSGMDVVDTIAALETDDGDWPLYNVFIKAILKE